MKTLALTELKQFLRDRLASPTDLKKALSIGLGIAISRKMPFPGTDIEGAALYFNNTLSFQVVHDAQCFNEQLVVDIDLVEETARAFWLMRFYQAFPLFTVPLTSEEDGHFLNKLGGCGHLITPDTFAFCQDNASTMVLLVNRIRAATEEC